MWWQYLITIVSTVVSGVLVYAVQNLLRENDRLRREHKEADLVKQKALSDGVMSLLKIQLIEYHDKYMADGNIPTYVYDNWDIMYNSYRKLGGNGMVEHLNEEIDRLRVGGKPKHDNH